MNLSINFIQPQEIRSASMVSVKSMIQIGTVMIPLVLVLFFASTYFSYAEHKSSLNLLEGTWSIKEKQLKRAQALNKNLLERRRALEEIEGWRISRMPWPDILSQLRVEVPPTIQLKVLQARQNFEAPASGPPQRTVRVTLNGRCIGPDAENRVDRLRADLLTQSRLGAFVQDARVAGFREDDESGAGPDDRTFQIQLNFIPRSFHAASTK